MRRALLLSFLVGVPACVAPGPMRRAAAAGPPRPALVIFVADGAGDYRACSKSMRETAEADGLPIAIESFPWSHGYGRNLSDQIDHEHSRRMGACLAARIREQIAADPTTPVAVLGHSAGAAVALAAADHLPPVSIDRMVLFAPSVSVTYDVRPALRASRHGLDNYMSEADRVWLGAVTNVVGTADAAPTRRAAGRYGFEPCVASADELALVRTRLHQWAWNPSLNPTGHEGKHFGAYQPGHLRAFVFPRLLGPDGG